MDLSNYIIIILLTSCVCIWIISFFNKCPSQSLLPPKIIYQYKPELDLQFDESNFPSKIYTNVFTGNNVSQGGYNLLNTGRISLSDKNKRV